MSRQGLTAQQLEIIESGYVTAIQLVKLDFESGPVYFHTGTGEFLWDDVTWTGAGELGRINRVIESRGLAQRGITLTLNGLEEGLAGKAQDPAEYSQRDAEIYLAILDLTFALIGEPLLIWRGHMDDMEITTGDKRGDSISLSCESELDSFDRSNGAKYTAETQAKFFDNDDFFQFLHDIEDANIVWRGGSSDNIAGSNFDFGGVFNIGHRGSFF